MKRLLGNMWVLLLLLLGLSLSGRSFAMMEVEFVNTFSVPVFPKLYASTGNDGSYMVPPNSRSGLITVPDDPAVYFVIRTECKSDGGMGSFYDCTTGDCDGAGCQSLTDISDATIIEITKQTNGGFKYVANNAYGSNVGKVIIQPFGGPGGVRLTCGVTGCPRNLQVPDNSGAIVACMKPAVNQKWMQSVDSYPSAGCRIPNTPVTGTTRPPATIVPGSRLSFIRYQPRLSISLMRKNYMQFG